MQEQMAAELGRCLEVWSGGDCDCQGHDCLHERKLVTHRLAGAATEGDVPAGTVQLPQQSSNAMHVFGVCWRRGLFVTTAVHKYDCHINNCHTALQGSSCRLPATGGTLTWLQR
jgi:hypothetical protein